MAAVPGACRPAPWTPAAARGCLPTRWASSPSPYPSYPEPSKALRGVGLWPGRGHHLCVYPVPRGVDAQTQIGTRQPWLSAGLGPGHRGPDPPRGLRDSCPVFLLFMRSLRIVLWLQCLAGRTGGAGKIEAAELGSWEPNPTKACDTRAPRPPVAWVSGSSPPHVFLPTPPGSAHSRARDLEQESLGS